MNSWFLRCYDKVILENPWASLIFVILFVGYFTLQTPKFKLDASAESLVLESDDDLSYYRNINKVYGSDDFLIITYTPFDEILSEHSLKGIKVLRDKLSQLEKVESVISILDVPLLNSPRVKISELSRNVRTLENQGTDKRLARKEFQESPIYRNRLVSLDGKTTALQVNFKRDNKYFSLMYSRNKLRQKKSLIGLTKEESKKLVEITKEFKSYHDLTLDKQSQLIKNVRRIIDTQRDKAEIFLGGLPMIISDMIDFIQHDLEVFGFGVICFLVLALVFFFGKLRWVLLPIFCCSITALVMLGYVGSMGWRVTVISSNFVSVLLIITISLSVHLIVRYRDLNADNPSLDQKTLVRETVSLMIQPCFYTAITTIVAFISLVVSDIRPVIDFGWIMTIGITLGFILNFIFFPAVLVLLKPEEGYSSKGITKTFTLKIASCTKKNINKIIMVCTILAIVSVMGISKLEVENRFIDNFKSTTEIYKGMEIIDQKLGGTTPLDIIINPDQEFYNYIKEIEQSEINFEDSLFDPFENEDKTKKEGQNYWFNEEMLNTVEDIHDRLEDFSEVGKVMSISTVIKVFKKLNGGKMLDDFELALLRKLAPGKVRDALVDPYLSDDANQIRINLRLIESDPSLRRKALIQKINLFLVEEIGFSEDQIRFTGMVVLYNNMLQSLYRSQITTIGFVFIAILIMFIILFRSVILAVLAIIPNILAAGFVLGVMGWFGIPLDMMTITIAAISIGIAVDNSIHYVHRFKKEFNHDRNYLTTMDRCHGSIGRAIYYTSVTVTVGFSILALSDFSPTIYFGLLTGLAMLVALLFNLTLLPVLIVLFKPLGVHNQNDGEGMQDNQFSVTIN